MCDVRNDTFLFKYSLRPPTAFSLQKSQNS